MPKSSISAKSEQITDNHTLCDSGDVDDSVIGVLVIKANFVNIINLQESQLSVKVTFRGLQ